MISLFFNWRLAQYPAAVLCALISVPILAQQQIEKVQPANKGFEVSGYLVQSDRELECNPEGAKAWAKKALDTAASARETDPAMIDTLGDLKSQSNIKIVEATKRLDLLNETAEQARGLIKQARLETAQARLQQIDPKGCYSNFKPMRSEIDERKSKADALVRQGDAVVDQNPKEAIKLYASARQVDVEYSGLDEKTNFARKPVSRIGVTGPVATTTVGSDDAVAFNGRGNAKYAKNDMDGAIADYTEAIRLKPDYAVALGNRGIAKRVKGDIDGAIADFTKAIDLKPDFAAAYNNRGLAKRVKGDMDGAIADYTKAIDINPADATAFSNRGDGKRVKGDMDGAIADYTKAIDLRPDYAVAYHNRGLSKYSKSDLDGAIADYTKAIYFKPDYADAYNNRGNAKYTKRDMDGAIADYTKFIDVKPDDATAFSNRGNAKRVKGDMEGAIADLSKAIDLKPDYAVAYNNRGLSKYSKSDMDGAVADYTKAIYFKPDYADAYNNRGNAKYTKRDMDGAIADLSKAIDLKPDYADAYNNRGNAKYSKSDMDGAIADYTKFIDIKPNDATGLSNRGNAKRIKGDMDGAIADLSKAIDLKPDYAVAYNNRGLAKQSKGDVAGASADFAKARPQAVAAAASSAPGYDSGKVSVPGETRAASLANLANPPSTVAANAQPKPVLVAIRKADPDYSPEARAAGLQGTVLLVLEVTEAGTVANVRVRRGLGMGLDERAVAAARQWQYEPFTNGPIMAAVEVPFKLESAGPWLVAGSRFSFPRVQGKLERPVLIRYISPDSGSCPKELVYVPVDLTVGRDGKPTDVRVGAAIDDRIGKAAIEAVGSWQFQPGTEDGKPEITSGTVLLECGAAPRAGGVSGGVSNVGGGTTPPSVIFRVDPEYSEEARKAKYSGTVMLSIVVDTAGRARDISVVQPLGKGLDEEAITAVTQWRFKPGTNRGQAVNARAKVEVNFRLI